MNDTEDTRPIATASILSKIRGLLDRADHESTPAPEAETCRAKAEQLMRDYRKTHAARLAVDPVSSTPELLTVFLCPATSEFTSEYYWMMRLIAGHCEVRMHYIWGTDALSGEYGIIAQLVGFEPDLRYAEMLFTAARIVFSEKLEPQVRPDFSDQENAYRLRSAGIPRNRVAQMLWGSALTGPEASAPAAKVAKLYKAQCEALGEDAALSGRTINAGTYRKAYAEGFRVAFSRRLQMAQDAAEGGTGAISLAGRDAAIDEAFWTRFPQYRPAPAGTVTPSTGKPKKSRRKGWTQADEDRYQRLQRSPGQDAGKAAAREVELGRTASKPTKLPRTTQPGELLG